VSVPLRPVAGSTDAVELSAGSGLRRRRLQARAFRWLCLAMTLSAVLFLALLLFEVLRDAWGWFDWDFLTSFPSRRPERAGIKAALAGRGGRGSGVDLGHCRVLLSIVGTGGKGASGGGRRVRHAPVIGILQPARAALSRRARGSRGSRSRW
jgi:hypothetical protein